MATVDDVNAEAQGNKLKALQAMAAGQSDPYNAGQQQVRDSQGSALTQLATSAATTGAPVGAMGELAPTVSGPGDAALASMAAGAAPLASSLSAVHATPVASGAPSSGLVGTPFPVQRYGPYVRYGGFGSQGEMEDAVLGDARARAGTAHDAAVENRVVQGRAGKAMLQTHGGSHVLGEAAYGGPVIAGAQYDAQQAGQPVPGAPPLERSPLGSYYVPAVSPDQQALLAAASGAMHGQPAAPVHTVPNPHAHAPLVDNQYDLFGAQGVQLGAADPSNPLELYRFAQQSALDHGVVPAVAAGHFSPEWGATLALQDLVQPNQLAAADLQGRERASNGGMTFSEQNQIGAAQAAIEARAVQSSPEYLAGQDAITQLAAGVSAGTSKLPSADELRIMLAQSGLPPAVVVQLMKDYGGFAVAGGTAQATDPARFADPYGTTPGNGVGG